jgi:aerotolerance regulator-like protein
VTFLHPLVLLGLAAAAIPALLHLFERRAPPEAVFPPFRYLSEAERQTARRLKLQHLLLLLLRTALIGLVVLAAARPVVPARASGAHEPTALVVILDNSLSSGAVLDGRPLLDHLRAVARGSFAAAAAGDRLWLLLADGVARRGSGPALLAALDGVTASPQRLDLTQALALATRMVDAEPIAAREVHVVSDLQRTALGSGRVAVPPGVRVVVLAPGAAPPLNRGIGQIRAADGAVSVPLIGTPGASPGAVTVRLRGRAVGRAIAAPPSGVSLPLPALGPGWWVGEAVLDPDELRADDRRLFVWHVAPETRVSTAPDAGPFVAAAVAVLWDAKRVAHGNDVMVGGRPRGGGGTTIVFPPADRASLGELNRALAARGTKWRYGAPGTPGPIAAPELGQIGGVLVSRRYRIVTAMLNAERGSRADSAVMATVNGEPWLARDGDIVLVGSRLDTAWTALPRAPAFVPFVDALINRVARGERPVRAAEGAARVEFEVRGVDTIGATVYGPDPRESDLTPAPPELVRETLGAWALDEARFAAARFSGARRAEASGLLLALAMVVALVELGIATLTH